MIELSVWMETMVKTMKKREHRMEIQALDKAKPFDVLRITRAPVKSKAILEVIKTRKSSIFHGSTLIKASTI